MAYGAHRMASAARSINAKTLHPLTGNYRTMKQSEKTCTQVFNLIILDASGSMLPLQQTVINTFNELIQSIQASEKQDPDMLQWINLVRFSGDNIQEIIPVSPASDAIFLNTDNYQPSNFTPLYDAIGTSVTKLKLFLEQQALYRVLVTVITDGEENRSSEYTARSIQHLVTSLEEEGWLFTYMGANHNVKQVADLLKIGAYRQFDASHQGVSETMEDFNDARKRFVDSIRHRVMFDKRTFFESRKKKK